MIKAIIGNVGSGKSLLATYKVLNSQLPCFVNFNVRDDKTIRLKWKHLLKYESNKKGDSVIKDVNWDFWNKAINKYRDFHIFIDELHNLMSARRSMSKINVTVSKWISQIRKIMGSSEMSHLFCISQSLRYIDIYIRELISEITYCEKIQTDDLIKTRIYHKGKPKDVLMNKTFIKYMVFSGEDCIEKFDDFKYDGLRSWSRRYILLGNPIFQYFDSYELVRFGEGEYI